MEELTLLGAAKTIYPARPEDAKLETFNNPRIGTPRYTITFHCHEFTSRCPLTQQPAFGTLEITYAPRFLCLESKSLKLWLGAFREVGAFWEDLTNRIASDLYTVLRPVWIRVEAHQSIRGGIGITCRVTLGEEGG